MRASPTLFFVGCLSAPFVSTQALAQNTASDSEDIVVTAQRVESLASKTPIALTVLRGDDLDDQGVYDSSTLAQYVPNFQIDPGNTSRITIRGVTSFDFTGKGDPSAAFLLDGVYIARPADADIAFFDQARIEVLRGPQGTLYGRNSTAGVVNVISNRPTNEFEAALNAGVGNLGTLQADAMINIPVTDGFALRAAGSWDRHDNYLFPAAGDPIELGDSRDELSARVQGLITFSSDASLLIRGDYRELGADSIQSSVLLTNFFNLTDPLNPRYFDSDSRIQRTLTYNQAIAGSESGHNWGLAAEFNWNLGPVELTYLGSHRETDLDQTSSFFFFVATPVFIADQHSQDSHELRLATTGNGPFRAQVGVYYFKERVETTTLSVLPPGFGFGFFNIIENPTKARSYAAFGQATFDITPELHLTGGLRYTRDRKSRVGGSALQFGPVFNPATDFLTPDDAAVEFDKVTWRLGIDYDLNANSLLYASVSTGYKSGGFNGGCLPAPGCTNPNAFLFYEPETLTAYEIGAHLRFDNNRLQFNAAAFYYDYTNLQLLSIVTLNGAPSGQITNAAAAEVMGVELDATYVPNARHRLQAAVTFLDADYVDYFPLGAGNPPSFAGRPLDSSPEFTLSGGYTYTQPIGSNYSLLFNVYSRYSSSYVGTGFTTAVQYRQPSFTKTNLTLTFRPNDERWYVQLFARNLENDIQITNVVVASPFAVGSANISEPRTFGVRTGIRF